MIRGPVMTNAMQHNHACNGNRRAGTCHLSGITLVALMAVTTLAPVAGCQNAPKATEQKSAQSGSEDTVKERATPATNWVSGIWVRNDPREDEPSKNLALFASPSGEIALGRLCGYTMTDDDTVEMVFTKPSDGVSEQYSMDMSFVRNADGTVAMHGTRDGYVEGEGVELITLPLTPRESALVGDGDDEWIVGWWTIPVGNRPYALCFFPDGSCTFTDQYGVYQVDGETAILKLRHGSQRTRELTQQPNGTVHLSRKATPGVKQRDQDVVFTRKQRKPV